MNSTLDIIPFKNGCSGEIIIPGSKSISNRALLLAALSNCRTTLSGVLKSQDVELMIKALKTLGIGIIENWVKNEVEIQGCVVLFLKNREVVCGKCRNSCQIPNGMACYTEKCHLSHGWFFRNEKKAHLSAS